MRVCCGSYVNLYSPQSFGKGEELVQSYQNQDSDDGNVRTGYASGCHFLMRYGFASSDTVVVALPSPEAAGLGIAEPPSSVGLRRSLLSNLGLPAPPLDPESAEPEGATSMMAVGADGLAALALEESPMAGASRSGKAAESWRLIIGAPREEGEAKLLCTLRIRRLPEPVLMGCAQHGSLRQW